MVNNDQKLREEFGLPYNYYIILKQRTQKGHRDYYRKGSVVADALSFHAKHVMHLKQGSTVYYDKGRVLSINKGIRYIAVKQNEVVYVENDTDDNNQKVPFNSYTVIKRRLNKHSQVYHRSGICIATDATQRIDSGQTVYYDYGRIIEVKNGVQFIAVPKSDLVLSGVPKD